jgi:hypothetical protein
LPPIRLARDGATALAYNTMAAAPGRQIHICGLHPDARTTDFFPATVTRCCSDEIPTAVTAADADAVALTDATDRAPRMVPIGTETTLGLSIAPACPWR